MSLKRLESIVRECSDRHVKAIVTINPTGCQVEIEVNDNEFIPGVAIQVSNIEEGCYRSLDDLATEVIDDLAIAALKAHADEVPKRRRR